MSWAKEKSELRHWVKKIIASKTHGTLSQIPEAIGVSDSELRGFLYKDQGTSERVKDKLRGFVAKWREENEQRLEIGSDDSNSQLKSYFSSIAQQSHRSCVYGEINLVGCWFGFKKEMYGDKLVPWFFILENIGEHVTYMSVEWSSKVYSADKDLERGYFFRSSGVAMKSHNRLHLSSDDGLPVKKDIFAYIRNDSDTGELWAEGIDVYSNFNREREGGTREFRVSRVISVTDPKAPFSRDEIPAEFLSSLMALVDKEVDWHDLIWKTPELSAFIKRIGFGNWMLDCRPFHWLQNQVKMPVGQVSPDHA